ncbi:MAG: hypothetical protein AB7O43_08055 [Hyphomicrobiaceae bacterium]
MQKIMLDVTLTVIAITVIALVMVVSRLPRLTLAACFGRLPRPSSLRRTPADTRHPQLMLEHGLKR